MLETEATDIRTETADVFGTETPGAGQGAVGLSDTGLDAPFVIEHRKEEYDGSGSFRPSARLVLTERVRTSGLWRALTPEDFKTLALLLTFLTPNGWCRPTLPELSDAMGVSRGKARARLDRLAASQWRGQPLAAVLPRPDGLDAFLPGRQLVAHVEEAVAQAPPPALGPTAGKEAVTAHSRARYARTRAEVEAQIGDMMGWAPPDFAGEDPAVAEGKRKAYKAMTDLGVAKDQALDLLGRHGLADVERQIAWLPARHAKSPARFLAAAIEGGYDAPLAVRRPAAETGDELALRSIPADDGQGRSE